PLGTARSPQRQASSPQRHSSPRQIIAPAQAAVTAVGEQHALAPGRPATPPEEITRHLGAPTTDTRVRYRVRVQGRSGYEPDPAPPCPAQSRAAPDPRARPHTG